MTATPITFTALEYASIAELPDTCFRLLQTAERHSIFLGQTWFEVFCAELVNPTQRVRVIGIFADSNLSRAIAVIPLWQERGSGHLESLANYYSSYYAPIIDDDIAENSQILSAVFDAFLRSLDTSSTWLTLKLFPMTVSATWLSTFVDCAQRRGLYTQSYFCFGNWYLPVTTLTSAQYFATRTSRLRNTLSRKHKQLNAQAELNIRIVTALNDLALAYRLYQQVYARSWKKPESHPGFIEKMLRAYAAKGQLRLGLLTVNGEAAAAQIWLVTQHCASIFKLAYDEKFAPYSVGSLLTEAMFTHVLDHDKVSEVDYLSGDDSYKKDWMSHRRERWGLLLINRRSLLGKGLFLRHALPAMLKRWVKRKSTPNG